MRIRHALRVPGKGLCGQPVQHIGRGDPRYRETGHTFVVVLLRDRRYGDPEKYADYCRRHESEPCPQCIEILSSQFTQGGH